MFVSFDLSWVTGPLKDRFVILDICGLTMLTASEATTGKVDDVSNAVTVIAKGVAFCGESEEVHSWLGWPGTMEVSMVSGQVANRPWLSRQNEEPWFVPALADRCQLRPTGQGNPSRTPNPFQ